MYSFEIFPPKREEGFKILQETCVGLNKLRPLFFSVTFGANGSSQNNTVKLVQQLIYQKLPVVPHLSAVGMTEPRLKELLQIYQSLHIKQLIVIRGDLPLNHPVGKIEYPYAIDLVRTIRQLTGNFFHITVAAYPEFHPQSTSPKADLLHLKEKVQAGANSVITQLFFNTDAFFQFLDQCAKLQIHVPIIPGVILMNDYLRIRHFTQICGAEIPLWMQKRLEAIDTPENQGEELTEIILRLCENLRHHGIQQMHFYTINQAMMTQKIVKHVFNDYSYPQTAGVSP